MFGISLNPLHYALVGSLVINLILGGYSYVAKIKLSDCRASQHATEVLGKAQEAEAKRLNKESKQHQLEANKYYEDTIAKYSADNDRLRKQIASSRILPSTSQVCTEGTKRTEINWPYIEQTIRDYRQRVRELTQEGDNCIAGLDSSKQWYSEEID